MEGAESDRRIEVSDFLPLFSAPSASPRETCCSNEVAAGDTQNQPVDERAFTVPRPTAEGGDVQLTGFPQFTITRGGAYCFLPSLSAFTWLAEV